MVLGQWVKTNRLAAGMSQKDLSLKLDITVCHISHIENSKCKVSFETLQRFVDVFGQPYVIEPREQE